MRHIAATASLLFVAGLLGACGKPWPPPGTPLYQNGWAAGCDSGYTEAGRDGYSRNYRKGAEYGTESDYKQGWDEGYTYCYERERRTPWMMGGDRPG